MRRKEQLAVGYTHYAIGLLTVGYGCAAAHGGIAELTLSIERKISEVRSLFSQTHCYAAEPMPILYYL